MPLLDKLREQYGVGSVCSELHIAPSTYYHCQQQRHHPDKRSARAQRDDWLKKEIQRVYDENHKVYGVRKVWRQLLREGIRVARCTVARLMAVMGLAGVLRGKKVHTTVSRKAVAAGDRVNRHQGNMPRTPGGPQRLVYVVSAADKDKHTSAVPSALRQRCPQGFYPVQRYGAPRLTDELCALVTTLT